MAVSQVEMLKNPCRVTTWNNLVASQPPSSAQATPITQVRIRPCDLRPGISILASRPAPRPRTIHAMMPITDSSVSGEIDIRVAGPARQVAVGESNSCGLLPFSGPLRLYGADPNKKLRFLTASAIFTGRSCRVRSNIFILPHGSAGVHARDRSAVLAAVGRLSGLTQP